MTVRLRYYGVALDPSCETRTALLWGKGAQGSDERVENDWRGDCYGKWYLQCRALPISLLVIVITDMRILATPTHTMHDYSLAIQIA